MILNENFKLHLDVSVSEGWRGGVELPHGEADGVEHGDQTGLRHGVPGGLPPLQLVMESSSLGKYNHSLDTLE